jgi:hypothetical protein
LDNADCQRIVGWAWDSTRPNTPVRVELFDGDKLLATVPADMARRDLAQNGIGNGKHGFVYPVPRELRDGKPHSIRGKIAGTSVGLRKTQTLECPRE